MHAEHNKSGFSQRELCIIAKMYSKYYIHLQNTIFQQLNKLPAFCNALRREI